MWQTAGIKPDDPLLAPLKTCAQFASSEEWLERARAKVLKAEKWIVAA